MLKRLGLRRRFAFVALVCVGLLVFSFTLLPSRSRAKVQSPSKLKSKRARFVPGEVLVRYRSEPMAQSKTGEIALAMRDGEQIAARVERFEGSDFIPGLRLAHVAPENTLNAVAALKRQPDVLYAEPNYIFRASVTPNDQHLAFQYGLVKIAAQQAWDTTTGSSNVVVAVMDEGIDITHQDLQANIWTNPAPGSVPPITGDLHGYDFVNNTGNVFSNLDAETHATHVAGIIGAVSNNTQGIAGVNWTVRLMSLKFLDLAQGGSTVNVIRACSYAAEMRRLWDTTGQTQGANIRVINASFGEGLFSAAFLDSINVLNTRQILFVAAAGNIDNGTVEPNNDLVPQFPASFNVPNIISVASTDQNDTLSLPLDHTTFGDLGGSHFGGTSVDLAAPGESILSTTPPCSDPGGDDCDPDFPSNPGPTQDTYTSFTGTSMATPHVSGAAALLWARDPSLNVQQVKNLLLLNGDVQAGLVNKTLTGRRLNVFKSLQSLQEADTTAPGSVTNLHINSQNGRTIDLGWTAAGDDGAGGGSAALYEISFVDGISSAIIPLKGVIPGSPGAPQTAQVTVPFRHTSGTIRVRPFDNKGNEGTATNLSVSIPLVSGDPYTTSTGSAVPLSTGGTRMPLEGDDRYVETTFPASFTFPFFGTTFTEATISTNGNIFFSEPPVRRALQPGNLDVADDPPGTPRALGGYKMIAGLWEDLDLRVSVVRPDAGVYFGAPGPGGVLQTPTASSNSIIFRWQGVPCAFDGIECTGGAPVNFEIELNKNGTIKTRYGNNDANLFPTVGVGGGDQEPYVIASHTFQEVAPEDLPRNLSNAGEVTFSPRATTTGGVQFAQAALNVNESAGSLNINVTRTGDTSTAGTVNFATTDNFGANCSVANGQAAANCDYNSAGSTLQFAAGETSKTLTLSIVNDGFVEENETFTVTLSSPTGMTLGSTASTTITIVDNDATPTNPFENNAFFVRQQYLDFLFREPDTGGFNDWLNVLTNCPPNQGGLGSDPGCDRVHVSSGFFRSTEFGERGYWAYRFYHGTLGRRPQFAEFVPDMRRLSGTLTPEQQEAARAAFVADFMARSEFTAIYAGLTNAANAAQFIAKLEEKAGVTLPATNTTLPGQPPQFGRQELIDKMASGEFTAAQTLRAFIEQKVVFDQFFFRAFVAMQYFGYLLRDPEDAGYNDWVDVLTNGRGTIPPGDFRHLIFGFVWSVEYRQRFGP